MTISPRHSLRRSYTLVVLAVALVLAAPGTASGQDAATPDVLATVLVPDGLEPALAVASYGVVDDPEPTLVVTFAEPFGPPDVFRHRIDLHVGKPTDEHQRISFVAEAGVPTGAVEVGSGDEWESTGAVPVDFAAGVLRMGLPEDLRNVDGDLAWLEVALVEDDGGAATVAATPLVPAADLLQHADPVVAAASNAWGSVDEQPPLPPVDTGDAPDMRIDGDEIVVTFQVAVPTEVAGTAVASVADVVRITDTMTDGAGAPYLLVIDHGAKTVSLLDGTNPIPSEVPTDGAWLLEGLPEGGVEAGTEIRASLPLVLEAFGLPSSSPTADAELGLGIARSVRLDDGAETGRVIRADGVVASATWLSAVPDSGSATTLSPTSVTTQAAAGAGGEEEGNGRLIGPSAVIACLIALLGIGAFLLLRWIEHRRHTLAMGPPAPPRPVTPPSPEDRAMLEDFSRQLFDGER